MSTFRSAGSRPVAGPEDPGPAPALRRDVVRNRAKLLKAADQLVRARGQDATIEEIARHAGLGVGTAYRHFANKRTLLEALLAERLDRVVALMDEAAAMDDAGRALEWFLERAGALQAADRGLREAISATDDFDALSAGRDRLAAGAEQLVDRARAAGAVRSDFARTDIPVLFWMIGAVADYAGDVAPDLWRRYLELMLDGIRPVSTARAALPAPALDPDQIERALSSLGRGRMSR